MQETTSVFDATRPVALQLRTPEGVKTIRVRFPSDDEWADRQRRRKVVIKDLGRNVRETTMPGGEEVDAALLAKIRSEDSPEVDAFEAAKLIEELAYCVVDDVVPVSDGDLTFSGVTQIMPTTASAKTLEISEAQRVPFSISASDIQGRVA